MLSIFFFLNPGQTIGWEEGLFSNSLKMIKNGAIWCILSDPKYIIINLKIKTFTDNKSRVTKFIRHIFLQYQSRCAC